MSFSPSGISSSLLRKLVQGAVRIYYPRMVFEVKEHLDGDGPILFVANHPNSIIDPVVLGMAAGRQVRFLAKAPLFDMPIFGRAIAALGMIPAFRVEDGGRARDNMKSLETAADQLIEGHCIGVFPEGRSLDGQHLNAIKGGTARIAVDAFKRGAKKLRIIPVGLNFEQKESFLSNAWIRIGKPIVLQDLTEQIETEEKKATRKITQNIQSSLKEVMIHLDNPKWDPFLQTLETLVPPPEGAPKTPTLPLIQRNRIADAMNHFFSKSPDFANETAGDVLEFIESLKKHGVRPRSPFLRESRLIALPRLIWQTLHMGLGIAAASIGSLFYAIPYSIRRMLTTKWKDPGLTTIALYRLLSGLLVYTLWHAGAFVILSSNFLPWIAWTVTLLLPLLGIHALNWWPALARIGADWKEAWSVLTQPNAFEKLRSKHTATSKELRELLDEYCREKKLPPLVDQLVPRKVIWMKRGLAWGIVIMMTVLAWFSFRSNRTDQIPELSVVSPGFQDRDISQTQKWIERDTPALIAILGGLDELEERAMALRQDFIEDRKSYFNQKDNDEIRALLLSYLNYRTALTRILWRYQEADTIQDTELRQRAQTLLVASAGSLYDASLKLVVFFGESRESIVKLNEPEPVWDIPAGIYDSTREQLQNNDYTSWLLNRINDWDQAYHQSPPPSDPDDLTLHSRIEKNNASIRSLLPKLNKGLIETVTEDSLNAKDSVVYSVQSFASYWIGKAQVRKSNMGATLISNAQVDELSQILQPGDIIIERRNWFLSNAFLPGYWPHAALYIGTTDQLEALGIRDQDKVKPHWPHLASASKEPPVIIEALAPGVILTSLEYSVGEADSVCVIRPKVSQEQKKKAILNAFSHLGKSYDFDFNFFSSDKLVCTELVFRSYDECIEFPLVDVMGRKTLPAMELLSDHFKKLDSDTSPYEFITFLDGDDNTGKAIKCDEEALRESLTRSSFTFMQ